MMAAGHPMSQMDQMAMQNEGEQGLDLEAQMNVNL